MNTLIAHAVSDRRSALTCGDLHNPHPEGVVAMPTDWSSEESEYVPPQAPAAPILGTPVAEDVTTAPLVVTPEPVPLRNTEPFRIYSPDDPDLTDEMRLEIELRMTAGYWLQKALEDENRIELPDEFRERHVVWKLVLQEAAVALVILLMGALLFTGWIGGMANLVVVGLMLVMVIVGLYFYKLWSITFVVSTMAKTGISRARVRWMLINEIEPELDTRAILLSRPYRNILFSTLNINWWRVHLDTAAQNESAAALQVRFVRDGERMVRTVEGFKLAQR